MFPINNTELPAGFGLYLPQQGGTILQQQVKAAMWIFTPRNMTAQAVRPLAYQFDDQFINQTAHAMMKADKTKDSTDLNRLLNSPLMAETVRPEYDRFNYVALDKFSDRYTFVMAISNAGNLRSNLLISTNAPGSISRTLYYGYFLGEPYNTVFHGSDPTFNFMAPMIITHKTVINQATSYLPSGSQTQYNTVVDASIVTPQELALITDPTRPAHMQTPNVLYDTMDATSARHNGGVMWDTIGSETEVVNQAGQQAIAGALNVPVRHMNRIIKSVAAVNAGISADSKLGPLSGGGGTGFFADEVTHRMSEQLRAISGISQYTELQENQLYTLGDIDRMYNPEVVIIQQPQHTLHGAQDQSIISVANQYNSLLTMVVPMILGAAGLSHLMFSYDSYGDGFEPKFTSWAVGSAVPMTEQEKLDRVAAVMHELKNGVFAQMLKRDHFTLHMNADTATMTQVTLNFACDNHKVVEPFEVPSVMGGLLTPLVADADVFARNGHELHNLVNILTGAGGVDKATVPVEYQNQFVSGINRYDNAVAGNQMGGTTAIPLMGQQGPTSPLPVLGGIDYNLTGI